MANNREVILAKTAGFCFGVNRAIDTVYDQIEKSKEDNIPVYSLGPIIHNENVVKDLESRGVITVNSLDELETYPVGNVIIRSHGVDRCTYEKISEMGFTVIDATCPFVKKIHLIVEKESRAGNNIIIVGDKNHPEVQGIKGWCLNEPLFAKNLDEFKKALQMVKGDTVVVEQTTFNSIIFKDFVEFLHENIYNDVSIYETICNATDVRQKEASDIAGNVDAMIVIGGLNSSNTQKLFEICKERCTNTYYIQTLVDLDLTALESARRVGITAGASTPNYIIKEVHDACQN